MYARTTWHAIAIVCATVGFGAAASVAAQRTAGKIELRGTPTSVDSANGTFVIARPTTTPTSEPVQAPVRVVTTDATRFENAPDAGVTKAQFFASLRATDVVDVEGELTVQTVTAARVVIHDE